MEASRFAMLVSTSLIMGLLLVSCEKEVAPINDNESYDKSSYTLKIFGAGGAGVTDDHKLIHGKTIESTWDDELGLVWLGTDRDSVPIATITFEVGEFHEYSEYDYVDAHKIHISTTDVRVGTSEQLNAKLYTAEEGEILFFKRGGNYVTGLLRVHNMSEINTGQLVFVTCDFVVVSD